MYAHIKNKRKKILQNYMIYIFDYREKIIIHCNEEYDIDLS